MSETLDTVQIVRRRLADGRTIADADVNRLVAEIDRLRHKLFLAYTSQGFRADYAAEMAGYPEAEVSQYRPDPR